MASPIAINRLNLPPLNRRLLNEIKSSVPADLEVPDYPSDLPIRAVQFGEGVFVRGFIDWMIDSANRQEFFNGSIAVVQPRAGGIVGRLAAQDGLFTVVLRGSEDGRDVVRRRCVGSVRQTINPYTEFEKLMALAREPSLRFMFSNTTEAGLALDPDDRPGGQPPPSFPAKLTLLLHERWRHFQGDPDKGLILLPCELLEKNGELLKACILQTIGSWEFPSPFAEWIERHNFFCNTLVDRIVTGYPAADAAEIDRQLGYHDGMLLAGEPYHLFAVEGPADLEEELPLRQAGLNVVWTNDLTPYRERKVRVLNGAHTAMMPIAFLAGHDTVLEAMNDPDIGLFIRRLIHDEILPTLDGDPADLRAYAASVLDRFRNPFNRHELLAISLNSISKFRVRLLPSLLKFATANAKLPDCICRALAALIVFYRVGNDESGKRGGQSYELNDDPKTIAVFASEWAKFDAGQPINGLVNNILADTNLWQQDLTAIPSLAERITELVRSGLETGRWH